MDQHHGFGGTSRTKRLGTAIVLVVAAGVAAVLAVVAASSTPAARTGHAGCGGSPPVAAAVQPTGAAAIALDGSISTNGRALRQSYVDAALSALQVAADRNWAVRIVVFGASGVGARVVFAGSFMPASTVYAFNVAARNRLICLAKKALASAFVGRARIGGTDLAGTISEQIAWGRAAVRPRGRVSLLALTDGCQAPSRLGTNAHLTDLCGELENGRKPGWILRHDGREFSLGGARGVLITMEGVGVGRDQSAASTLNAEKLVAFWRLDCHRSKAVCKIGSAVS